MLKVNWYSYNTAFKKCEIKELLLMHMVMLIFPERIGVNKSGIREHYDYGATGGYTASAGLCRAVKAVSVNFLLMNFYNRTKLHFGKKTIYSIFIWLSIYSLYFTM